MADKPFAYGPNNPHPLLQMCAGLVWEASKVNEKNAGDLPGDNNGD